MILTLWHWILLLTSISISLFCFGKWKNGYFARNGVKNTKDSVPLLGHLKSMLTGKKNIVYTLTDSYDAFPNERYVGFYEFTKPVVLVRDLDLLKLLTTKDFDHFTDHRGLIDKDIDPLFGRHLFTLTGQEWRDMRATLSPAFTSSKMKNMFLLIDNCARTASQHFLREAKNAEDCVEYDMTDVFTRFANDVIASCAFGVQVDSLESQENDFYKMGLRAAKFPKSRMMKIFAHRMMPGLFKLIGVPIIEKDIGDFFRNLVQGAMGERERTGLVRHDMIHLLMEANKGKLKHESVTKEVDLGFATVEESAVGKRDIERKWSDDDLTAQALLFFLAGFDTVSTMLSFFALEMVRNPDVQQKIQQEIDRVNGEIGGKLTYNDLGRLKYLDAAISESLRMWPPAASVDRVCVKDYKLPPPSDNSTKSYTIKKDEVIWVPIYAIHHDPKYYPSPYKFDPDRFSEENRASIHPYAFIPFGAGPRSCIGSRFALMEIKSIIYYILLNFDLVSTPKTAMNPKFDPKQIKVAVEGGIWIGFVPRKIKLN